MGSGEAMGSRLHFSFSVECRPLLLPKFIFVPRVTLSKNQVIPNRSSLPFSPQYPKLCELVQFAKSRGSAAMCHGRVLPGRHPPLESDRAFVEKPIDDFLLTIRQLFLGMNPPELRFREDPVKNVLGTLNSPGKAAEKPGQPLGDVACPLLRPLQDVVVTFPLRHDLSGEAIVTHPLHIQPSNDSIYSNNLSTLIGLWKTLVNLS